MQRYILKFLLVISLFAVLVGSNNLVIASQHTNSLPTGKLLLAGMLGSYLFIRKCEEKKNDHRYSARKISDALKSLEKHTTCMYCENDGRVNCPKAPKEKERKRTIIQKDLRSENLKGCLYCVGEKLGFLSFCALAGIGFAKLLYK